VGGEPVLVHKRCLSSFTKRKGKKIRGGRRLPEKNPSGDDRSEYIFINLVVLSLKGRGLNILGALHRGGRDREE